MGISKTELFSEVDNQLALAAKAFAHPARIAILHHIAQSNACINSDLVQELGLAQATISQHLRELKEIGVIQGAIEGTRMNYCINPVRWAELRALFLGFFDQYQPGMKAECC